MESGEKAYCLIGVLRERIEKNFKLICLIGVLLAERMEKKIFPWKDTFHISQKVETHKRGGFWKW